jgi:signal transduction histidine kinase
MKKPEKPKKTAPTKQAKKPTPVPKAASTPRADHEDAETKIASLTESNRQLKRKIFDLYTIFEISRNFNSVLDYQMLLDTFILTSLAQVGASKAAIFLRPNQLSDKIIMVKKRGSGDFPKEDEFFSESGALALHISKLNRPFPTGELLAEQATAAEKKILNRFHPGLVVPLIFENKLRGLFIISEKMSNREFGMDDNEFLSILGSQISVAIENARLYEAEKMSTQQLRSAQQQLVNSERLAALGEMSAKVAHEINNPLGIIKNYILLIRRSVAQNAEAGNYADIVSQEINRIAGIVRELLNFHRPEVIAFKQVNIVELTEEVLQLMERQLEKHDIRIIRSFDQHLSPIEAAPENLKQVFLNVIINAVDAMENSGTLAVSLEPGENEVIIKFNDSGPGIPAEIIPHIFEPFFTTKEPGKGTGLGLSVCYGIVKKHNGTLTFSNTKTGGCFEIRLPIQQPKQS